MERAAQHLLDTASRDALTGLHNRRLFDEILTREFELASENGWPLALGFIDLDHFKSVNDTYGHQVGDAVLMRVATILTEHTRERDFVMRYGGEEFVALLPGVGIASHTDGERRAASTEELVGQADKALYQAKRLGRNRIRVEEFNAA